LSTLQVLGARVLVRPDKVKTERVISEEFSKVTDMPIDGAFALSGESKIVLAELVDAEAIFTGEVLGVGKGSCEECSRELVASVAVGDQVGYEPAGGQLIDVAGETLVMLRIENLIYVKRS
jgi:co-chaperonin GroES (HSP10)